ncbi:DUF3667 domain-containing protein [Flavobacterium aquicola]|uniref:Uncharacterized protein DUF3667 n=1 Tax=Flavobacterium aquicola TaxID=1682742 RepID=A0A3E0EV46_9FLAO|nr:DUF3667 domain-containing protein [Flavobacterium aquicola]REH02038.1 uncharacterized protein DUF3667 [Flavobacterium aquicola]
MICKNCNSEVTHNFCPNCGQPSKLKRIDAHYISHEIEHVLHFDRGILFTVRELFINPGQNIRNYISENRSRLVKPVIFIILTSLIYTIINHFFHIEDQYLKYEGLETTAFVKILGWMQANYGYMNILTSTFIAIWLKVFFKKYSYNFFELLIMLCFTMGVSMLIFAFFAIIQGVFHIKLFGLAGIIGIIYLVWATGSFFEEKKIANYFKALISYLLGMITFLFFILAIGITIDLLIKH